MPGMLFRFAGFVVQKSYVVTSGDLMEAKIEAQFQLLQAVHSVMRCLVFQDAL